MHVSWARIKVVFFHGCASVHLSASDSHLLNQKDTRPQLTPLNVFLCVGRAGVNVTTWISGQVDKSFGEINCPEFRISSYNNNMLNIFSPIDFFFSDNTCIGDINRCVCLCLSVC